MLFLLRFMAMKAAVSSPFFILKPMDLRLCSPVSGGSTLVTSAPMSARTWQQNGPAITCVRSRTFSFSSGNIESRTLHLAVAYAFDCGSLLPPRRRPSPAQGVHAFYHVRPQNNQRGERKERECDGPMWEDGDVSSAYGGGLHQRLLQQAAEDKAQYHRR